LAELHHRGPCGRPAETGLKAATLLSLQDGFCRELDVGGLHRLPSRVFREFRRLSGDLKADLLEDDAKLYGGVVPNPLRAGLFYQAVDGGQAELRL
jgi:hypothetical protein